MSEERNYLYKVTPDDSILIGRVYTDSSRMNFEVEDYKGRRGIFKPSLNLDTRTFCIPKGKRTSSEYGEFIAHKVAEKMGIESCDVKLVKRFITKSYSKSDFGNYVPGVISYIDLQPGEDLIPATEIISQFKADVAKGIINFFVQMEYRGNKGNENQNNDVEVIIPAFLNFFRKNGSTNEELSDIRQKIIDMIVFDCRMANRDRHSKNYGVAIKDGKVRFYPLYDNEGILGFSEAIGKLNKLGIEKNLYSIMGIVSKKFGVTSFAVLTYLFSTFPLETQKAYEKVIKFTEQDLIELMNECEGLPAENKYYATRMFRLKGKELELIQQKFIDSDGRPIKQILPVNNPIEILRKQKKAEIYER